jgi:hypothetical protein
VRFYAQAQKVGRHITNEEVQKAVGVSDSFMIGLVEAGLVLPLRLKNGVVEP